MKNNKYLISMIFIFLFTVLLFAQENDNDYQKLLSKMQPILGKKVEDISNADINAIDNLINMSPNIFGKGNSSLMNNLIKQANAKKSEYQGYQATLKSNNETLDALDKEASLRAVAEEQVGELQIENASLKDIITELQNKVTKLENQTKKIDAANRKLEKENLASKELLQQSGDLVAQMLNLVGSVRVDAATESQIPQTLKDSIADAQCGVASLMKTNFLVTIQQLEANKTFMDSASAYYKLNNKHSVEIKSYIDIGNTLVERLRKSGIECAIGYSSDIENEINDFVTLIETRDSSKGLNEWIANNLWVIPVLLILAIGITVIIVKTSNKKKE